MEVARASCLQSRTKYTTPESNTKPSEYAILVRIVHRVRFSGPTNSIAVTEIMNYSLIRIYFKFSYNIKE